jgi:chromosomal replication initiation ATPase DnaA
VLHLLDETGAYIESLPLRDRPAVLDVEAQAEQLRQNKTIINRAAKRLQDLHAEDTREALEDLAANSKEMQRVVQVLPAACSDPANPAQPSRNVMAEQVAEVTRQTSVRVSREKAAGSPSDIVRRRTRTAECPF